jgi:hypothetical protein
MRHSALVAAGAVLFLSACSGISTSTDYDPSVNFSQFSTYQWHDTEGDNVDAITNSRITSAIDAELAKKGLKKVDSNGDLAVGYQVTTSERKSYNTVNTGWGGGYYWGGWGMGMGTSTTYETTWQEGSLVVGIFDTGTKNLVWTGTATTDLDQSRSPEERQAIINEGVQKMMKNFPPGS